MGAQRFEDIPDRFEHRLVEDFVRVGSFKEVVSWPQYIGLIHGWAPRLTNWESSFKRVTAADRRVFLELEERNTRETVTDVANTVTIYQFNKAGKLCHLDVYVAHIGER